MPSLHNISSKDILRFFLKQGFIIHHQKGSHIQLKKSHFHVTIPFHGAKTLKIKTVLSILKQADIDRSYFLKHV